MMDTIILRSSVYVSHPTGPSPYGRLTPPSPSRASTDTSRHVPVSLRSASLGTRLLARAERLARQRPAPDQHLIHEGGDRLGGELAVVRAIRVGDRHGGRLAGR